MYSYKREKEINEVKLERLVEWYKGGEVSPIQFDAEIHRRCNLECIACPRQANDFDLNKDSKEKELGKERWLEIADEAAELGVKKFNIEGGGEPTANPDVVYPVMERIKDKGMYGVITTNGTLLDEERIKWLVDIDWDRIHFSLDSFRAEDHDYLRHRKGAFKKTVENIKKLNELKEERGKEHPMLNINVIINKKNYEMLPEIVEFANELSADYIFTEPMMVFCPAGERLKVDVDESGEKLSESKRRAKKLTEEYKIDNNFATEDRNLDEDMVESTSDMSNVLGDFPDKGKDNILSSPCLKPWRLITVKYDGKTGHCGMINEGESIKKKSLEEIWYGERLTKIRNKMMKGQLLEHCDDCIPSDVTQRKRFKEDLEEKLEENQISI